MAGRQPPGSHERDTRWLVDRQIYERRADGARLVTWTRRRQLALLWAIVALVGLAAVAGGGAFWGWQRYGPGPDYLAGLVAPAAEPAVASGPPAEQLTTAPSNDGPLRREAEQLRARVEEAQTAQRETARQLAEAQARIGALESELTAARAAAVVEDEPGAKSGDGVDLELEMTLLRHERDAAREQIDALMQLSAHLKEELARVETAKPPAANGAAAPEGLEAVTAELSRSRGRELLLATSLKRLREQLEGRIATLDGELSGLRAELERVNAEREGLEQSLAASRAEHDAAQLTAERDRLAARVDELGVEQARLREERDRLGGEAAALRGELVEAAAVQSALEQRVAAATARIEELERAGGQRGAEDGVIPEALTMADDDDLDGALAAALARLKEIDRRLGESERRNGELETYLARYAPPPPPAAPR